MGTAGTQSQVQVYDPMCRDMASGAGTWHCVQGNDLRFRCVQEYHIMCMNAKLCAGKECQVPVLDNDRHAITIRCKDMYLCLFSKLTKLWCMLHGSQLEITGL